MLALGLPIILARAYVPVAVRNGADAAIGLVTTEFAVRLLILWSQGAAWA